MYVPGAFLASYWPDVTKCLLGHIGTCTKCLSDIWCAWSVQRRLLLLWGGLLLGRCLLLGGLLGLGGGGGLLLEAGRELVGALGLREVPVGHGLLQGVQERAVQPPS